MWPFLILLVALSALQTALNLALWRRRGALFAAFGLLVGGLWAVAPEAAAFSLQRLEALLSDLGFFQSACAFQIAESMLAVLLAIGLIRRHHSGLSPGIGASIPLPGGLLLAGALVAEVQVMNRLHGLPFGAIGAGLGLGLGLGLGGLVLALRRLLPAWDRVLELRVQLAALQLLLAAFAPLVVQGVSLHDSQFRVDVTTTLTSLGAMALLALAGFGVSLVRGRR
ncbi:MAG: hypothetical protein GY913_16455 [Proteobacteria bacterium]|nr:hypothetical protein [Pseudomonadota bacterium]MCP4918497.1 hypothetical protein [Pseudomonadota bacterium]